MEPAMTFLNRIVLPVALAAIWVSLSEFVRNEFLVKSYWLAHFEKLGIVFPSAPVNGAVWGLWSLLFAVTVFILSRKFSLLQTTLLAWFVGFAMMWVVIGNLGVLPYGLLVFAVPLSLLESFLAVLIVRKFAAT
jgi:hypothetical protein